MQKPEFWIWKVNEKVLSFPHPAATWIPCTYVVSEQLKYLGSNVEMCFRLQIRRNIWLIMSDHTKLSYLKKIWNHSLGQPYYQAFLHFELV